MLKTLLSFGALAYCLTLSAGPLGHPMSLDDVELDAKGSFVSCQLQNGSTLYANLDMVIYNNEILSKYTSPQAFIGNTAEFLLYSSHQYEVLVSKQFCAREGIQAVSIINTLTGEKIESVCISKNICD
jgi:hypothetical protein